jgi:hypothetical protein
MINAIPEKKIKPNPAGRVLVITICVGTAISCEEYEVLRCVMVTSVLTVPPSTLRVIETAFLLVFKNRK